MRGAGQVFSNRILIENFSERIKGIPAAQMIASAYSHALPCPYDLYGN